ncbi:MAG: hypothetical protein AABZ30_04910, partial [Myxococcota bacterium]
QVLTVVGGVPAWASTSVGANAALSNLSAVAINTSLLPGIDDTIDLGSAAFAWRRAYLGTSAIFTGASFSTTLNFANPAAARTITLPDATGTAITTGNLGDISATGLVSVGTWQGSTVAQGYGGTGQSVYSAGDLLYANAAATLTKLGVGGAGQVLTVAGGLPVWSAVPAHAHATLTRGAGMSGASYDGTGATTWDVAYGTAASTAVQGNQTATITAGGGLAGSIAADALGDGFSATLDIGAGNGIAVAADAIALGALASDWSQTGTGDIVLGNAASELRVLESVGGTFYGTFDVGDLAADQTYTFGAGGTVWTSGSDGAGSTLDADLLDGFSSAAFAAAAHTHATLTRGVGLTGANYDGGAATIWDVAYGTAAGTAVQGNQTAAITAGGGLTGTMPADALGDGFAATLDIGAGNGIAVAADSVALGTLGSDWSQTGAGDIILDNAGSDLQIREAGGSATYGTFTVGPLATNQTYTFTTGGTVWTSGNVAMYTPAPAASVTCVLNCDGGVARRMLVQYATCPAGSLVTGCGKWAEVSTDPGQPYACGNQNCDHYTDIEYVTNRCAGYYWKTIAAAVSFRVVAQCLYLP